MKEVIEVLYGMLLKDNFLRWKEFFPVDNLPKEVQEIFNNIGQHYVENPTVTELDVKDFNTTFRTKYASEISRNVYYDELLKKILLADSTYGNPRSVDISMLSKSLDNKAIATVILDSCRNLLDGREPNEQKCLELMQDKIAKHIDKLYRRKRIEESITTLDADDSALSTEDAYSWSLRSLDEYIGGYNNHLIVFGAVPDGGKTAALIGQCVFQAETLYFNDDTEGILLFFSNDQGKTPMLRRIKSCIVEQPYYDWAKDRKSTDKTVLSKLGRMDRIILVDAAGMSTYDIERLIGRYSGNVRGVYIDQLYKVRSYVPKSGNEVERVAGLFSWGRDIAKSVCPVLTVHQISSKCEPSEFLDMNAFYGIKTQMQGEADVIVTINISKETPNLRYCKVAKTKVYGPGHDPIKAESHRQFYCQINRELSRLESI